MRLIKDFAAFSRKIFLDGKEVYRQVSDMPAQFKQWT